MAKYEGVVIHVVKELEAVAFGKLRNGEGVYLITKVTSAACDKSPDGSIEGRHLLGVIIPNNDRERRERSPWVCINVNDISDEEAFNSSNPPSIKNDDEIVNGSGNSKRPETTPGKVAINEALYYLIEEETKLRENLDSPEAKARVGLDLITEGVDLLDDFSAKVKDRLTQLKNEQREQARFEVAAALSDPEIIELILAHDGTTPEATDDSGEENPYETIPGAVALAAG